MKIVFRLVVVIAALAIMSCATWELKPERNAEPLSPDKILLPEIKSSRNDNRFPPHSKRKGSELLQLVRLMEGGACKNDYQGAKGIFLLYSSPTDIERIKSEQGKQVFVDFEKQIQKFSLVAFNQAVKATNIVQNPFALDSDDAQRKVAVELIRNFSDAVANYIEDFQEKTKLTIDVVPFAQSFEFFINGCEATHIHPKRIDGVSSNNPTS